MKSVIKACGLVWLMALPAFGLECIETGEGGSRFTFSDDVAIVTNPNGKSTLYECPRSYELITCRRKADHTPAGAIFSLLFDQTMIVEAIWFEGKSEAAFMEVFEVTCRG